jgi:hypothetical protein
VIARRETAVSALGQRSAAMIAAIVQVSGMPDPR